MLIASMCAHSSTSKIKGTTALISWQCAAAAAHFCLPILLLLLLLLQVSVDEGAHNSVEVEFADAKAGRPQVHI
jgi:hypothetical protein